MTLKCKNFTWKKIWHATSLYETLMPLYKISKILGLSPYDYKLKNGIYEYVFSYFGTFYSVLFAILYIAVFCYTRDDHDQFKLSIGNNKSKVASAIDAFQWYATVSLMTVLVIGNCTGQNKLLAALRKMELIDNELESYGLEIYHSKAKRAVTGIVVWQTAIFIIIERLNCSLFLTEVRMHSSICYILCYLPLLIDGVVKTQFVGLVLLLKYRFKAVNRKLNMTITPKSYFYGKIIPIMPVATLHTPSQEIIAKMRKIHGKICDVGFLINRAFSFQILFIIAYNFISFTAHTYFCMESLIRVYIENTTVSFGLITTSLWAIVKLSLLLHLSYICTETKNKGLQSAVVLHTSQNRHHDAIREEIIAFSKQILHRKFKFTACGLFDIDMGMFYTMVASATTYLIILTQMDVAINQNFKLFTANGSSNTQ